MTYLLFVLLCLAHFAGGASSDSTDSSCPPPSGTTRSVWSILGSCGLTLLICVWHALHIDVPKPTDGWLETTTERVVFVLLSFFAPEVVVAGAGQEWCKAHRQTKEIREKGYEWSMTHSFFAEMNGFVYRDDKGGLKTIDPNKLLELCKEGKISNPLITEKEIKGWGKSDAVGKVIFTLQLFWFMLQVVARGSSDLAVTLVELDTVCMALLALVYLFFWWDKPLRPDSPYVFWYTGEKKVYSQKELSDAWKSKPSRWRTLLRHGVCMGKASSIADQEKTTSDVPCLSKPGKLATIIENLDMDNVYFFALFVSWIILGGLHLIAWNFEFPTEIERKIWRIASLVLLGSSPVLGVAIIMAIIGDNSRLDWMMKIGAAMALVVVVAAVTSRALLVGLMLASLRALPCSANETVTWTVYIPHL